MMSKVIRFMSGVLTPLIFVYGAYIIAHGHLTPGGGFQGGAIVGSGVMLLIVAYGAEAIHRKFKERHLVLMESAGSLLFIGLGFAGLFVTFFFNFLLGTPFLGNIPPYGPNGGDFNTGGFLALMNLAVGLKVTAGISVVLLTLGIASSVAEDKKK
jgi:multisubunit Na+/H+ antiporter MnhB subunit